MDFQRVSTQGTESLWSAHIEGREWISNDRIQQADASDERRERIVYVCTVLDGSYESWENYLNMSLKPTTKIVERGIEAIIRGQERKFRDLSDGVFAVARELFAQNQVDPQRCKDEADLAGRLADLTIQIAERVEKVRDVQVPADTGPELAETLEELDMANCDVKAPLRLVTAMQMSVVAQVLQEAQLGQVKQRCLAESKTELLDALDTLHALAKSLEACVEGIFPEEEEADTAEKASVDSGESRSE